jgi:hypothetical protein
VVESGSTYVLRLQDILWSLQAQNQASREKCRKKVKRSTTVAGDFARWLAMVVAALSRLVD